MERTSIVSIIVVVLALGSFIAGQTLRPPSPAGSSAAQIGGKYVEGLDALKQITDPKTRVLFAQGDRSTRAANGSKSRVADRSNAEGTSGAPDRITARHFTQVLRSGALERTCRRA